MKVARAAHHVKKHDAEPEIPAAKPVAKPRKPRAADAPEIKRPTGSTSGTQDDAQLVKRCVAGEVVAWEEIYQLCHEPLLVSVRILLGRHANDRNLVDEIPARVWYAVVKKDGDLLSRFDPTRGARLITFLRTLAKDEISRYFRAEFRRRERLLAVLRERRQPRLEELGAPDDSLDEFLGTLTPHERAFCSDYLLSNPAEEDGQRKSLANIWQLSRRVYRKLLKFLDHPASQ
jgi:hypothetical protein